MNIVLDCPIHNLYVDPQIAHLPCIYCLCDNSALLKHLTIRAKYFLKNLNKLDSPFTQYDIENDLKALSKWRNESSNDLKYFENFISRFVEDEYNIFSLNYSILNNNFTVRIKAHGPSQYTQFDAFNIYQPVDLSKISDDLLLHKQRKSPKEISSYFNQRLVNEALLLQPSTLTTIKILDPKLYKKYGLHRTLSNDDLETSLVLEENLKIATEDIHSNTTDHIDRVSDLESNLTLSALNNELNIDSVQNNDYLSETPSFDEFCNVAIPETPIENDPNLETDNILTFEMDLESLDNYLIETPHDYRETLDLFNDFNNDRPLKKPTRSPVLIEKSPNTYYTTELKDELEEVDTGHLDTIFFNEIQSLNENPISTKIKRTNNSFFFDLEVDDIECNPPPKLDNLDGAFFTLDPEIEQKELVEELDCVDQEILFYDETYCSEETNFSPKINSTISTPQDKTKEIIFQPSTCSLHHEYLILSVLHDHPCFFCMCEDLKEAQASIQILKKNNANIFSLAKKNPSVDITPKGRQNKFDCAKGRLWNHFHDKKNNAIKSIKRIFLTLFPSINQVDYHFDNRSDSYGAFKLKSESNSFLMVHSARFFIKTDLETKLLENFLVNCDISFHKLKTKKPINNPNTNLTRNQSLVKFAKTIQGLTEQLVIATNAKNAYVAKNPKKRSHSTLHKKKIFKGLLPLNRKITFINKQIKDTVIKNQKILPNVNLTKPNIRVDELNTIKFSNLLGETVEIHFFEP